AVWMMTMEYFRPAMDQPEFGWITHVGTRNRRRRIAERIGAIAHRLVFESKVLMLHVHVVNAERLATIVDRTATWTVCVGQRIALREEVALLVEGAECLVADFVVDQHELTEVGAGTVLNDGLPAARGRCGIACAQRLEVARSARLDDECTEETHHRQFTIVA